MEPYKRMKVEDLQKLLREDAHNPGGMDYEELLPILEALVSGREYKSDRTEQAWENFQKFYFPGAVWP